MDFFAEIYGMILNLIKSILDVFGADTSVVDGLIKDLEDSQKEDENATV